MAARRGPGPVAVLALLALLGPGWPLRGARAVLNLQELSELKYGLEILAEPVLAGQVRRGTGDNADTKRKVEEISEELRTLDTRLWSDRDSETSSESPEGTQEGNQPDPAKDVTAGDQEVTVTASDQRDSTREPSPRAAGARAADPRKKIHFKVIRSPGDLLQFIEELKESTRKAKEKASEEEEAAKAPPAPPGPTEPPSPETLPGPKTPPAGEEEEEEDEDEEEEAGPLLAGLELLPREQVARLKEEVKSQMEQEFDSIISEVGTPGWAGTLLDGLGSPQ
ncbi:protein OS-9 [Turdus rufiventris]|nr:protein OS-9 [Turdus rufiventris]